MSLWSKITGFLGKVAPVLSFIPGIGPIAAAIGKISAVTSAVGAAVGRGAPARVMPGVGAVGPPAARRGGFSQFRLPSAGRRFITTPPIRQAGPVQLPSLPGRGPQQMSIFAALPSVLRGGRAVGRVLGRGLGGRAGAAAGVAGFAAGALTGGEAPDESGRCPVGFHLNKQEGVGGPARTYCVRNRRMNVGNAHAARRSVRRLKGARKLLKDIERMMPSKPRARRAGHATPSPIIHT